MCFIIESVHFKFKYNWIKRSFVNVKQGRGLVAY